MSGSRQNGTLTILAGENLPEYSRVRFNGTAWVLAGATEVAHAITCHAIDNTYRGAAWPFTDGGVFPVQAAAALAIGANAYAAAGGEVSSTGGKFLGIVVEASGDANDSCSILYLPNIDTKNVLNFTADGSVTVADSGAVITNLGAAGAVQVSLPSAPPPGVFFHAVASAAQALRLNPGDNDAFYHGGAKQTDGKYLWADDEGESIFVISNSAGDWLTLHPNGTWTIEA